MNRLSFQSKWKINSKSIIFYFLAALALLLVLSIYLWYFKTSVFSGNNNYYSQLALSFQRGLLSLQEKPGAALLALNNPYDYQSRKGIDFPWDTSLYEGRFYLYWGPVPALLLTVFDDKLLSKIGDRHLTFVFTSGLFIYIFVFSLTLWHHYFQKLPRSMFLLAAVTMGLALPATWILSTPRIYEASIAGGQFFFIGGCFWAYTSVVNKTSRTWRLFIASIHWACAIGSRITLLPAVLFLVVMVLIKVGHDSRTSIISKGTTAAISALILPIAVGGIGLAWYNWARFGSILETGLRYQLTSTDYINSGSTLFSIENMPGNLYNYFTHAFATTRIFPYVKPVENVGTNERMVGLLFTVPYFLLALISPATLISQPTEEPEKVEENYPHRSLNWLVLSLIGVTIINSTLLLSYYFAAMRFLSDVVPSLLLLSTVCFWRGYQAIQAGMARASFAIMIFLLSTISIISSTLFTIAISGERLSAIMRTVKSISIMFK